MKFGIVPFEGGGTNIKERFSLLIDHLSNKLGEKVKLYTATDYSGIITALCHGHIDVAYLGPKSYVEARKKCNVKLVGKEVSIKGFSGYHGLIIARNDLNIKTFQGAKNKTFAFTGPNSTSGYLVPSIRFLRNVPPINPDKYFKEIKFSGSHIASILSIKNKTIDIVATNNVDLKHMIDRGKIAKKDFNILWKSELIPGAVIVAKRKLKTKYYNKFQEIMLKLPMEITNSLGNRGFTQVNDNEYDIIRYLMNLKKKLEKK